MRRLGRPLALALLLATSAGARAQFQDPQDEAYELAAIEVDHAVCAFPLSDEQQDVIAQRREALTASGQVSDADIAALKAQLMSSARGQQADGLCRPDGPEARLYKRRLTRFGLL